MDAGYAAYSIARRPTGCQTAILLLATGGSCAQGVGDRRVVGERLCTYSAQVHDPLPPAPCFARSPVCITIEARTHSIPSPLKLNMQCAASTFQGKAIVAPTKARVQMRSTKVVAAFNAEKMGKVRLRTPPWAPCGHVIGLRRVVPLGRDCSGLSAVVSTAAPLVARIRIICPHGEIGRAAASGGRAMYGDVVVRRRCRRACCLVSRGSLAWTNGMMRKGHQHVLHRCVGCVSPTYRRIRSASGLGRSRTPSHQDLSPARGHDRSDQFSPSRAYEGAVCDVSACG